MEKSILIERTKTPKPKPDQTNLGFGKYFTDHMFIMEYAAGKDWYDPENYSLRSSGTGPFNHGLPLRSDHL